MPCAVFLGWLHQPPVEHCCWQQSAGHQTQAVQQLVNSSMRPGHQLWLSAGLSPPSTSCNLKPHLLASSITQHEARLARQPTTNAS
jgi:hypothetical protein